MGFGAWAIGGPWRFGWGAVDDDESVAAIRHAVELGVNWVDTAAVYGLGHSEEVVGRALAPYRVGEDVFVFTKCGRRWEGRPDGEIGNDLRPESIREECESSLRRLGVERIDLYQVHWPDWTTGTPIEDSWATMAALVDEGKVRWIGVSNFDVELLERCEAVRHVDSVQPPLSLLARGVRTDRAAVGGRARHRRARATRPSPRASSPADSTASGSQALDEDDWRRSAPAFQEPAVSRSLALVDRLRIVADGLGSTLPALAVAWVLAQPGVTAAIVGARTPRHVDGWVDRVGARARRIDTLRAIDGASAETGAGSDEPPEPPPHIDAPERRDDESSSADEAGPALDRQDQRRDSRGRGRVGPRGRRRGCESGRGAGTGCTRTSTGSREHTARTRRCSGTPTSTRSTSRSRTRCTTNGRCRALRAGKHVLCEKPYSRDPADVEEAFDDRRAAGLVLMEAFMYRHHPQTHAIAAHVRDGALGKLLSVRSTFTFPLASLADVRARPELAGGALMDVGCYCVSGSRLIAGEPVSVFGVETKGPNGIDMAFHGTMQFADEVVGQFEASFVAPQRQALEVVGDEAVLMAFAPWRTDWPGELRVIRGTGGRGRAGSERERLRPRAREHGGCSRRRRPGSTRRRRRSRPGTYDRRALPLRRERSGSTSLARSVHDAYLIVNEPFIDVA